MAKTLLHLMPGGSDNRESGEENLLQNAPTTSTPRYTSDRVTPTSISESNGADIIEKQFPNGGLYTGTFANNIPHGRGKYLWPDGRMYVGEWKEGKASGKGKFWWPSGATFEGEFKSGLMEGTGTFIGADRDMYRGSWSGDRKHGFGVRNYSNGDYYEGQWRRNLQDGQGRFLWSNGNAYFGEWKNGTIHGRGVLMWTNWNRYYGDWENGVPKGSGVFTWPNGSWHICSWSSDPCNNILTESSSSTMPMPNISPNGEFRGVIEGWRKGKFLGCGSFGSVYEGMADNGFFFAVKEVSLLDEGDHGKQSIIQLEREIDLLSQFEHENIVQYYGTKKDESHLYIILELVTKGSLRSLYQKYELQPPQVSAYTRQILEGLKYLHDRNVVHRDIKCANILVHTNAVVKLADFGLAKVTKLNDVMSCKGTWRWMAPEVVGCQGYGLPADICSLGCTVLEMLTECHPYSEFEEAAAALFRIGRGERPPIPDSLPNDARDFILECLQVDPSLRPTANQLLDHPFVKRPLQSYSGTSSQLLQADLS